MTYRTGSPSLPTPCPLYLSDLISYYSTPCSFPSHTGLHAASGTQEASHSLKAFPSAVPLPPELVTHSPRPPENQTKPNLEWCSLASFMSLFKCHFPCISTCPSSLPCFAYHHLTYAGFYLLDLFIVSLHHNVSFRRQWFFCSFCSLLHPPTWCKWMNNYSATLYVYGTDTYIISVGEGEARRET